MSTLNTSLSIPLIIEGIFAGHSFDFNLPKIETEPGGAWSFNVYKDEASLFSVMELTVGDGLTINETTINIKRTIAQNLLKPRRYFFELRYDHADNTSTQAFYGTLIVNSLADIVAYTRAHVAYVAQGKKGLDGASSALLFTGTKAEADALEVTAGQQIRVAADETENGDSTIYLVLPDLSRQKIIIIPNI